MVGISTAVGQRMKATLEQLFIYSTWQRRLGLPEKELALLSLDLSLNIASDVQ